jgi:AraC-like DNA-binding protein
MTESRHVRLYDIEIQALMKGSNRGIFATIDLDASCSASAGANSLEGDHTCNSAFSGSRETEMAWSTVLRFTDPLPCQEAIQGSVIEVFPTARGRFDTEITKVRFDRLWMQRFHSSLPQVITVVHKPDRKAISFITEPKSPRLQHCGIDVLLGDIIVSRNDIIHQRFDPDIRNGGMSLPTSELNAAFEAVTGREFSESQQRTILRPDAAIVSRLLRLHKAVGQLAHDAPEVLMLPEVGRALEEQLIHLMMRCLAEGAVTMTTTGPRRHDAIIDRFEAFLESNPDRPLYLTEICSAIGVAERTLRAACEEHLGMGPIRYLTLRRMHLVRRALLRADPSNTTVTCVVTDHGFWELGRFSVAYRLLFGESPSETLRRPEPAAINLNRPSSLPVVQALAFH